MRPRFRVEGRRGRCPPARGDRGGDGPCPRRGRGLRRKHERRWRCGRDVVDPHGHDHFGDVVHARDDQCNFDERLDDAEHLLFGGGGLRRRKLLERRLKHRASAQCS